MKKSIIVLMAILIFVIKNAVALDVNPSTLHMIIFAATDDENIGESCDLDFNNMAALATDITNNTPLTLKTYYYKSATNKKKQLEYVLKNIKVENNDVVFFYYSGHGYRTQNSNSNYPRVAILNENETFSQKNQGHSVEEIIIEISYHKPRLSIVMIDACNTKLSLKEPADSGLSGLSQKQQQLKRLFMDAKGQVIMCGSKPGDGNEYSGYYSGYSWSNKLIGGYFTYNFNKALQNLFRSSKAANWKDLLANTEAYTKAYSADLLRGKSRGSDIQIPILEYNEK